MSANEQGEKLVLQFIRIMNKFNASEKAPKYYGTDVLLYSSEIHTIEAIGKKPKTGVTDLAIHLGVTKGAISQMIMKLIKKEMVRKIRVSPKDNGVELELTEKGIKAFQMHEEIHRQMNAEIAKQILSSSRESIEACAGILTSVESFLDYRKSTK